MIPLTGSLTYNDKKIIRTAVMHDATEAYVGDMVRPLKRLPSMATYREMERNIWRLMCVKWDLWERLPDVVKEADETMLVVEGLHLFEPEIVKKWNLPNVDHVMLQHELWEPNTTSGRFVVKVRGLSPRYAEEEFRALCGTVDIT